MSRILRLPREGAFASRTIRRMRRHATLLLAALIVVPVLAQTPPGGGQQQPPPAGGAPPGPGGGAGQGANRGPRPYDQVITAAARSERGVLAVHKVADRYFFEIDNAMLGRDFLLVSRLSGAPAGGGGFQTRRELGQRAHGAMGEARQHDVPQEHQRGCLRRRVPADREVRGAEQLRADSGGVSDRGVWQGQPDVGRRRDGFLRERHARAVGPLDRRAPHVRRAALRSAAELHQRHPIVSHQRRSAARPDVRGH